MDPNAASRKTAGPARRPLRLAAIGLSSAAAIGLLVGMNGGDPGAAAPTAPVAPAYAAAWPGYADLVEQIMPAVVTVTTTRAPDVQMMGDGPGEFRGPEGFRFRFGEGGPRPEEFERFMRRFFGQTPPFGGPGEMMPGMPIRGAGSGFIIEPDGLIVTNNHVVEQATEITVTLHDGREFDAEIVGRDPDTDLALLKIDAENLPVVRFADSDKVRVGDPVIAVGNPFGLGGTVTAGIVSAKNRTIGAGRYDDFLQIDAPINRGNSGGPTFNLQGEVIGVNSAIQSPTGGNVGIGFAIPANLVQRIIADLQDDGRVERGWLGVRIQAIDSDLAEGLGLDEAKGALVAQVTPDSPAAAAGLERGDVILEFAGKPIHELRELTRAVADTAPGSDAEIVVWRDGREQTLEVEVGEMAAENRVLARAEAPQDQTDAPKLGVMLAELTPDARASLDLGDDTKGVVVTAVQPGSPAAEKGLQRGDVIVEVDRKPVTEPGMVAEAVQAAAERGDHTILFLIKRDGQDRFVAVPLSRA